MAHIDTLKRIFVQKELTYTEIGKKLGLTSSTVKKKFESDNINTVIDFLGALGLKVIDEDGIDIITNEPTQEKMVQYGNLIMSESEFKDFKDKLLNG